MSIRLAAWIAEEEGRRPATIEAMPGATSSSLYRIGFDAGVDLIARLFTNLPWLEAEPDLAVHEAAVLELLSGTDLPSPELVAVDPYGARLGVPAVLMTRLPGAVQLPESPSDQWLAAIGKALLRIHAVDAAGLSWTYDPWITTLEPPAWSENRTLWQQAATVVRDGLPEESPGLLHRDYHPTNVLWTDDFISGIVDWVNACAGPPSSDVAHCRLNLALMYGPATADRFTELLERPYDPVWDVAPALSVAPDLDVYPPWSEFGLVGLTARTVRDRLEAFVARAV